MPATAKWITSASVADRREGVGRSDLYSLTIPDRSGSVTHALPDWGGVGVDDGG
jgi:hypothetical protein